MFKHSSCCAEYLCLKNKGTTTSRKHIHLDSCDLPSRLLQLWTIYIIHCGVPVFFSLQSTLYLVAFHLENFHVCDSKHLLLSVCKLNLSAYLVLLYSITIFIDNS